MKIPIVILVGYSFAKNLSQRDKKWYDPPLEDYAKVENSNQDDITNDDIMKKVTQFSISLMNDADLSVDQRSEKVRDELTRLMMIRDSESSQQDIKNRIDELIKLMDKLKQENNSLINQKQTSGLGPPGLDIITKNSKLDSEKAKKTKLPVVKKLVKPVVKKEHVIKKEPQAPPPGAHKKSTHHSHNHINKIQKSSSKNKQASSSRPNKKQRSAFTPGVDCRTTVQGEYDNGDPNTGYSGDVGITRSGYTCQPFDEDVPHAIPAVLRIEYPNMNVALGGVGKCRNFGVGVLPWCYTTDPEVVWDYCNIPHCDELDVGGNSCDSCTVLDEYEPAVPTTWTHPCFRHHTNPNKYYKCDGGFEHEMDCPVGLVWNSYYNTCMAGIGIY